MVYVTAMDPNPDVRTGRHVVYNLHVHLVFVTKYRRKAFTDAMLTRTEEIMREVCADFEAELKQFNGEQDHVHLLVHYLPRSSSPSWSTASRASAPAGSARSTTAMSAGTCGADTSGQAPTSQDHAAGHP